MGITFLLNTISKTLLIPVYNKCHVALEQFTLFLIITIHFVTVQEAIYNQFLRNETGFLFQSYWNTIFHYSYVMDF